VVFIKTQTIQSPIYTVVTSISLC